METLKNRSTMVMRSLFLCVLVVLSLIGCGDSEEATKMDVLRAKGVELSAELARKKAMQAITVTNVEWPYEKVAWTPRTFIQEYAHNLECEYAAVQADSSHQIPDQGCYNSLGGSVYNWQLHCTIDVVSQVLKGNSIVLRGRDADNVFGKFLLEPQSAAVRAGILENADWIISLVGRQLESLAIDLEGCQNAGANIAILADTIRKIDELYVSGAELSVAVSESERNSTPDREVAANRSLTSNELSRFAAVRSLVGGKAVGDEHFKVPGDGVGFCTQARLTAQAQKALGVIRESGISPNVVQAVHEINTEDMLEGDVDGGSIRDRLEAKWNTTIEGDSILDFLGLEVKDFHEARVYLSQEIAAFSRSLSQTSTVIGSNPVYAQYASVVTPVGQVEPSYFAAIGRSAPSGHEYFTVNRFGSPCTRRLGGVVYNANYPVAADDNLASFRGRVVDTIACINSGISDNVASSADLASLNSLVEELNGDYDGTLEQDNTYPVTYSTEGSVTNVHVGSLISSSVFISHMRGAKVEYGYRIVHSEEALHCYTTGAIEGVPCSSRESLEKGGWLIAELLPNSAGMSGLVQNWDGNGKERWYLLRSRKPVDLEPNSNTWSVAPGGWESILGFEASAPRPSRDYVSGGATQISTKREIPIFRSIEKRVAEILAPNKDYCSEPQEYCVGLGSKDPIPLEDELTDDGSEYEGSWKHYLTLAQSAATKSDELADAYLEFGISVDQFKLSEEEKQIAREEKVLSYFERIQEICGTSVDPSPLIKAFNGSLGNYSIGEGTVSEACGPYSVAAPGSHMICAGGRWVRSWRSMLESDPALEPLKQCLMGTGVLGEESTQAFVHLGDASICIDSLAVKRECGGPNQPACKPNELVSVNKQTGAETCPENMSRVSAQEGLGFFNTRTVVESSGDEFDICADIRLARATRDDAAISRIRNSSKLGFAKLQSLAKNTYITPYAGMYAEVQVGGSIFRTGSTSNGPLVGQWPCAAATRNAGCVVGSRAFGCSSYNCGSYTQRGLATNRLMRAALGIKASLWDSSFGTLSYPIPFQLYNGLSPKNYTLDGTSKLWRSSGEATPINTKNSDEWRTWEASATTNVWPDVYAWSNDYALIGGPSLGHNWYLTQRDSVPPSLFGFHDVDVSSGLVDAKKFWAGVGNLGAIDGQSDGCVIKSILGEAEPMKACDGTIEFDTGVPQNGFKCPHDFMLFGRAGKWARDNDVVGPVAGGLEEILLPCVEGFAIDTTSVEYKNTSWPEMYLDSLELLCMAQEVENAASSCGEAPPTITRIEDIGKMGVYLECAGQKIVQQGAMVVFRDLPKAVIDPFRASGSNVWEVASGEIGTELGNLRTKLMSVYGIQSTVGNTVKKFGFEMKELEAAFRGFATDKELASVEFESRRAGENAACASAVSSLGGVSTVTEWGKVGSAAATCANSMAQIGYASKLRGLKEEGLEAAKEAAIARFNESFAGNVQILGEQSIALSGAMNDVNIGIGKVANLRKEAELAFSSAMWTMSQEAESVASVSNALTNRKALAYERYKRAELNARKTAYLAKRAIEQRFGQYLDQMTEALPLVEAPSTWEAKICSMSAINYDKFSSEEASESEVAAMADGFLGDYVQKLANVVESYRLVNGFQDGSDTSVVSLRDDIFPVKKLCQIDSNNYFKRSANLDIVSNGYDETKNGWFLDGCRFSPTSATVATPVANCITTTRNDELIRPTGTEESVPVFEIKFGDDVNNATSWNLCAGGWGTCGYQTGAKLAQVISLTPGYYAFSWYEKYFVGTTRTNVDPQVTDSNGMSARLIYSNSSFPLHSFWKKRWAIYKIESEDKYSIGFNPGSGPSPTFYPNRIGTIAAPMFERLPDKTADDYKEITVGYYESTDENGKAMSRACVDKDGSEFKNRWTRGCMKVCPDGYSSDCRSRAKEACYHEITFPISQRGIEAGDQFNYSGFARGSFNYRIHRVGLNVVGTGVRDCATSTAGSACNSGGFSTYTLLHQGPYLVRNHQGEDFEAKLREGKIEHARALAAERYITNPISSTDKTLLEDYMRREMAGRPLDGNFILRVWDDQGVDFKSIEDVQVILDYGYWTRQD